MSQGAHAPNADFDFLMGNWRVRHRRLKERLAGCAEWDEFEGRSAARKILGGAGNFDEVDIALPGDPYRGATLRTYDPATGNWLIYWFDSRFPGKLDPPMIGRFAGGVGTFYADQDFAGRQVRVRFIWSVISPQSCRWEQAFSADDGSTWETNWIMDFERLATPAPAG
jgi:hypothetical protein